MSDAAYERHLAERMERELARIEAEQEAEITALAEESILAEPYTTGDAA